MEFLRPLRPQPPKARRTDQASKWAFGLHLRTFPLRGHSIRHTTLLTVCPTAGLRTRPQQAGRECSCRLPHKLPTTSARDSILSLACSELWQASRTQFPKPLSAIKTPAGLMTPSGPDLGLASPGARADPAGIHRHASPWGLAEGLTPRPGAASRRLRSDAAIRRPGQDLMKPSDAR